MNAGPDLPRSSDDPSCARPETLRMQYQEIGMNARQILQAALGILALFLGVTGFSLQTFLANATEAGVNDLLYLIPLGNILLGAIFLAAFIIFVYWSREQEARLDRIISELNVWPDRSFATLRLLAIPACLGFLIVSGTWIWLLTTSFS